MFLGFYPATILSYSAASRSAQVHIPGLTDGASEGLTAIFAYPVGDDDRDTERKILTGAEVYVFFEQGQAHAPVIAFFRSHGSGVVVDTRRIRQKNIELLADAVITLQAPTVQVVGDVSVTGNLTVSGTVDGGVVKQGSVVLGSHRHGGVDSGNSQTTGPV